mmetsp:Transcript_6112/g.14837  ORF Transcript_6112/g.14837 Transcript_6112/m.14837 type:complete len:247 (+) Transcript_6112:658-1398(+)
MPAPPRRNSVFCSSIDLRLPVYQLRVMFSYEMMRHVLLRCACSRSRARSTAITPALQPMPARLYDLMSERILYLLMSIEQCDGVGLNSEQLTISMSMSSGVTPVLAMTPSNTSDMTAMASSRAPCIDWSGGVSNSGAGKYDSSPTPVRYSSFSWNASASSVKQPTARLFSMNARREIFCRSGGWCTSKSMRYTGYGCRTQYTVTASTTSTTPLTSIASGSTAPDDGGGDMARNDATSACSSALLSA